MCIKRCRPLLESPPGPNTGSNPPWVDFMTQYHYILLRIENLTRNLLIMAQSPKSKQAQYITIMVSCIFGEDGVNTPSPKVCSDGISRFILKTADTVELNDDPNGPDLIIEGRTFFEDISPAMEKLVGRLCVKLQESDGKPVELNYQPSIS